MKKAGVVATDNYYRGPPQIIKLDVECTGEPKVKIRPFPTKETVHYKEEEHIQFNSMYLCKRGGIVDFGFLGSQNSASIDRGGGGGDGGNAPEQ